MSRDVTLLCPELQKLCQQFLDLCKIQGINAFVTQTYRSAQEQDQLYAQGRTLPGAIVTNAKGGESAHNCTLADGSPGSKAFDYAILNADGKVDWNASDEQWLKSRSIGKSLGMDSGDRFPRPDYDHFELENWKSDAVV